MKRCLVFAFLLLGCAPLDGNSDKDRDRGGDDDANARAAWLKQYYGSDSPSNSYLDYRQVVAAHEISAWPSLLPGPALDATAPAWTNLGPFRGASIPGSTDDTNGCDSGRLRSIVTHPTNSQILYVATAGGGVFRSTNADPAATGDWTWTAITDGLPSSSAGGNLSTGDLAMSPTDPNTLYLGMGDPLAADGASKGFYLTSDGGNTWTAGGSLATTQRVWKILPVDGTTVLVGTDQGLYRSTDGGHSFTQIAINGQIATDPTTPDNVFNLTRFSNGNLALFRWSVSEGNGGFWYSTDVGLTWKQPTVSGVPGTAFGRATMVAMPTGAIGWALLANTNSALYTGLLKTTSSGQSWTWVAATNGSFDTGQGQYNQALAVDPANANNLWVGAQVGFYRSTDGAVTWTFAGTALMHNDYHVATWSQTGTKTLYVGDDGGLAVVRDPNRATLPSSLDLTYEDNRRNRGLASHLLYNVTGTIASSPADSRSRVAFGSQDDGVRVRRDSGSGLASSGKFDIAINGDGFGVLIHPLDGNQYLGSSNGGLLKSTDGGNTFNGVGAFSGTPLLFNVILKPDLADATGNTVLTFGNQDIYRSTDFGSTWTSMPKGTGWDPTAYIYNGEARGNEVVFVGATSVGTQGQISVNGGSTWTNLGVWDLSSLPRSVSIDTLNPSILYVSSVTWDANQHHVWRSTNTGASWTALDSTTNGFPYGLPVYLVKNDAKSSSTLYAATDMGLYRSTDSGATWARFGAGLPIVSVRDLYVAPDGSFLRAGTYGRGVWEISLATSTNTVTASITSPSADETISSGTAVSFSGSATDSDTTQTLSYAWNFGDGGSATGATASHTFTNSGSSNVTYSVSLTASDPTGAHGSATRNITVTPAMTSSGLINGDFETGTLSGWTTSGTTSNVTTAHGGAHAAQVGSTNPTTDSSIAQTFSAPAAGGTLSFYYKVTCPDSVSYDWATATLKDNTAGTTTTPLAKTCTNNNTWVQVTAPLTGGHSYTLTLANHDDNYAGDATYTLYDDVSIGASTPPPPPMSLVNGDFETGALSPWTTAAGSASISSTAHGGTHSAMLGKTTQTNGDSSIAQTFTATGTTLSFFYKVTCPDKVTYDWATATLKDNTAGTTTTPLAKTCTNNNTWVQVSATLVANHSYTLTLTSHDDNYAGDATYTLYDDVTVK